MHFLRKLWITGLLAMVAALGSVWAQQSPNDQSPQNPGATTESATPQSPATPANPTTTENPSVNASSASAQRHMSTEKEKHWSGSLVDVGCMAKTLGSGTSNASPAATAGTPAAATPHFTPAPDQLQQPGGQGAGATPAGQAGSAGRPGVGPTYPGQESGQNPDIEPNPVSAGRRGSGENGRGCEAVCGQHVNPVVWAGPVGRQGGAAR